MNNLERDGAILLGVLSRFPTAALQTTFVKMVYLLDNMHFEHLGEQMTSFTYRWDHFGPNAVGNAIVNKLEDLAQRNLIHTTRSTTPYENDANYYRVTEHVETTALPLNDSDWSFIGAVVEKYGGKSRDFVVAESKRTAPVLNAEQYDLLTFQKNEAIEFLRRSFFDDADFVENTKQAISAASGTWITLDELRAEVAQ